MKKQLANRIELFNMNDINTSDNGYYQGKILVISKSRMLHFNEEYINPQNQLLIAKGGFGCSPITMGSAVVGTFISDGEACHMTRSDFMGVLKNEVANELGYCPCGNEINDDLAMNALSREDNDTYICTDCERKELEKELEKLNLE